MAKVKRNLGKLFWGIFGIIFTGWNLTWSIHNQPKENIDVTKNPEETTQPIYTSLELAGKAFDSSGIPEPRVVFVRGFTSSVVTQTSIGIGVMPGVVEVVAISITT